MILCNFRKSTPPLQKVNGNSNGGGEGAVEVDHKSKSIELNLEFSKA